MMVPQGLPDHKAQQVRMVPKDRRAHKALLALLAQRVFKGHRGRRVLP